MKRKIALSLVLIMLFSLFPQLMIFSPESKMALAAGTNLATLKDVKGGVFVKKGGGNKEFKGINGMALAQGDTVRTDKGGSATVNFTTGSKMSVGPNTVFTVSKTKETKDSGGKISIKLKSGSLWNKVKRLVNVEDEYEIQTPTTVMGVRGTLFLASFNPSTGETTGSVMEGAVGVHQNTPSNEGQSERLVPMGNSVQVPSYQDQGHSTPPPPVPMDMNQIIESEDPSILARMAMDMVERIQELHQQNQSYLAVYQDSNDQVYLQGALQLAQINTLLADMTKQFMNAIQGTEQEQQMNEIFQEQNISTESLREQVEELTNEIKETRDNAVDTAEKAGISYDEIDRIIQNAPTASASTGVGSSTPIPPPPETPSTPPSGGGGPSSGSGDSGGDPGSGSGGNGGDPGQGEQGPKAASPGVILIKGENYYDESEFEPGDKLYFIFDRLVKVEPLLDIDVWNTALKNAYKDGTFGDGATVHLTMNNQADYAIQFIIELTEEVNLPKNGLAITIPSNKINYLMEEDDGVIEINSNVINSNVDVEFTIPALLFNNNVEYYGATVTNLEYPSEVEFTDVGSYAVYNDDLMPERFELVGSFETRIPINGYEEYWYLIGEPSAKVNMWYYNDSFQKIDLSEEWIDAEIVSISGKNTGPYSYTWRIVLPEIINSKIKTPLYKTSRDYFIDLKIIDEETEEEIIVEAVGAITKDNEAPIVKLERFDSDGPLYYLYLHTNEPIRNFQEDSFLEGFAITINGNNVNNLIQNVELNTYNVGYNRYDLALDISFETDESEFFVEDHLDSVTIAYSPNMVEDPEKRITDMAGNELSFSITLYNHEEGLGMWTDFSNPIVMFNDFAYIDNVIDYKKLIINTEEIFYTVNQEGSDQVLISVDNISKDCFKLVGLDGNPNNTITSIDFEIDNETQYGTITLELENLIDEPTFLIWDSDYVCEHGLAFTTFLDIKNVKLSNTEGAIVAFYDGNWYDRPEGFSLNFEPREYDMPNDNVVYTIKSWKGLDSIPSDLKPYFRLKNVVQPWDNSTVTHPRPTTAYFESIEYIRYEEGEDEDEVDQIIFVIEPGNLLYGGMIIPSPELNNRWGLNYQPYEYDFEPFLRLRYNKYYDNYDGNWTIMGV